MSKFKKAGIIILIVVLLDQALKIWIKTHMFLGESSYTDWGWNIKWFQIYFIENEGMAFGFIFPWEHGKLALSIFRIIAIIVIGIFIYRLSKQNAKSGLIYCLALIEAGAIGNMIDSAFYGLIFSESTYLPTGIAEMFPKAGGYAGFLHGRVVDMLYFPLIDTNLPDIFPFNTNWFPLHTGERFIFFRPVFNIADSAVTIGAIAMIIFNKKFFEADKNKENLSENV